MERFRVWGAVCLIFWSLGWNVASTLHAAQPADAVPETAEIVVRWKSPQASLVKLSEFIDAVQPGLGEGVKRFPLSSVTGLFGPDRKEVAGIDMSQDFWGIVFLEPGTLEPTIVYMVSATDVKTVEEALLNQSLEFHVVDNLVIFSEDEDAVDKVRDQLNRNDSTLWSRIDAPSKKLFDASDLSVLVNVRRLTDCNDAELSAVEGWIDTYCSQISIDSFEDQTEPLSENERAQLEAWLGMYGSAYRAIGYAVLNGIRDSNSLVLGVSFSPTAIRFESTLHVDEGTSASDFLARQTASSLPLVTSLPAGHGIYYSISADMAAYMDWSMELTRNMFKTLSGNESAALDAVLNEIAGSQYGEMAGYLSVGSNVPALQMGSVSIMTPTKSQREFSRMMVQFISKLKVPGSTQTIKLDKGFDSIGGVEIDRITTKQEFDEDEEDDESWNHFIQVLYGGEGIESLEMYQAKRELSVTGGGKEALLSLTTALDAPPAKGTPIAVARQRLTEKANFVVLADVARIILNGAPLAASENLVPIDASAVDGLKTESCFVGFSLKCEPTGIQSQIDIPLLQAQNIAKVLLPLIGTMK